MRVVIPYKDVGNRDIVYAVRSVLRHYRPCNEIIIVGDDPRLPPRIHESITWRWQYQTDVPDKENSIYLKLKAVPGTVLFMNDDHFFLRDMDDVPNFCRGRCGDYRAAGPYYNRLYRNTDPEWWDFDVHCPMLIDTDRFEWLGQMPLKSQYGNQTGLDPVLSPDFKVRTVEEFDAQVLSGQPFVSTTNALSRFVQPYLDRLFPEPEIWRESGHAIS